MRHFPSAPIATVFLFGTGPACSLAAECSPVEVAELCWAEPATKHSTTGLSSPFKVPDRFGTVDLDGPYLAPTPAAPPGAAMPEVWCAADNDCGEAPD